jgi:hypothetical protein
MGSAGILTSAVWCGTDGREDCMGENLIPFSAIVIICCDEACPRQASQSLSDLWPRIFKPVSTPRAFLKHSLRE